MHIDVLMDNNASQGFCAEWGLSFHILFNRQRILLDTGAGPDFAKNADALGVPLDQVDAAVLSHAHYDHGGGMEEFFRRNEKALFWLRAGAAENCWALKRDKWVYDGIPAGILKKYASRIRYAEGTMEIAPGVWLLSHTPDEEDPLMTRAGMFLKKEEGMVPDSFAHEQSMVLAQDDGVTVFNSCSHCGIVRIVEDVRLAFPDKRIKALLGGFHLYHAEADEVRKLARWIRFSGVEKIYTGHCTRHAVEWLEEELGDVVHRFHAGLRIDLE